MGNNLFFFNKKKDELVLKDSAFGQTTAVETHNASETAHPYIQGVLGNHIADKNNPHEVTKAQLGLGNVDNTSDANKPISSATQTALNNCVKKNESPTLDAGDEYRFNFVAGPQRAKLELTGLGFELKNETTGAEINLRSYRDVQIQAPQDGNLSLIQKGDDGAIIELRKDISINSASGREIEIKQQNGSAIKITATGDISLEPTAGNVVFSDGNPVITTKDKATTSALGVVKVDGETISANNGVISVTPEDWQKPADWIDIRSGAIPNSVYFLVGHSSDYSSYPTFAVSATVSNSGTYDVFVDGVKQATTASGTATELNWQTLALNSGWDVTTPSALHTHIVRVTPTTSTDTISQLRGNISGGAEQGVLWVHFSISNSINLANFLAESGNNNRYQNRLCQAVTADGNEIAVTSSITGAFRQADALVEIPKINFSGESINGYRAFTQANKLKKIQIKNGTLSGGSQFFYSGGIEKIEAENAFVELGNYSFSNATSIRKLPNLKLGTRGMDGFVRLDNLEPTFLDLSSATGQREIRFSGDSENITNLKGITVSDSAPFDGSSPQINVSYTDLDRNALVNLFNSMPTVSASQVCNITGTTGAADLTAEDLAIATTKGWTVTR